MCYGAVLPPFNITLTAELLNFQLMPMLPAIRGIHRFLPTQVSFFPKQFTVGILMGSQCF